MRVEPLLPDIAPRELRANIPDTEAFGSALDSLGALLNDAQSAEDAFAAGTGNLQNAVYRRAQADVALSVATAAAQRATQALQSILNMQV